MIQKTASSYLVLRDKLKINILPQGDITRELIGLTPDTAAVYLCQCLNEEQVHRMKRERITLILLSLGLGFWIFLNYQSGCLEAIPLPVFLAGPVLIFLSLWFSVRRFGPLRRNSLAGLMTVIQDVHERKSLETLCQAATLLDGGKRSSEWETETALRAAIARLLPRLSADEAALLPENVRQFLLAAVTDGRHNELTVAALLTLGSAKEEAVRPLAESLHASLIEIERIREAARECLIELQR